eukprot:2065429-Lingulodinium_polyedra.AAC.1
MRQRRRSPTRTKALSVQPPTHRRTSGVLQPWPLPCWLASSRPGLARLAPPPHGAGRTGSIRCT